MTPKEKARKIKEQRKKNPALPPDPFAPLSTQQIQAQERSALGPLEREIMGGIGRRESADVATINQGASSLATGLSGFDDRARGAYTGAQGRVAATNDALAQRVSGQGTDLSAQLGERLKASGVEDPSLAAGAAARGTAGANAGYAHGTFTLDELASRGASAESFYGGLPAIAKQQGARDVASRRSAAVGERGDARLKLAEILAGNIKGARDTEFDKAVARYGFQEKAAAGAAAATMPDSGLSSTLGYLVDSSGNPILGSDGKQIPTQGAKKDAATTREEKLEAMREQREERAKAKTERRTAFYEVRESAFERAREMAKGEKVKVPPSLASPGGEEIKKPTREEAAAALIAEYGPPLQAQGWGEKAVQQMIQRALTAAGL